MPIEYLFGNRLLIFTEDSTFLISTHMLPSVDCLKIYGQKYLPWLSGPETKNLSFPLSVPYSLSTDCLKKSKWGDSSILELNQNVTST